MPRTVLVTGAAGQDGVLLSRHLLGLGDRVVGVVMPGIPVDLGVYLAGVDLVEQDVVDTAGFADLVARVEPDEIYHLAGLTSVAASWSDPDAVLEVNAHAVERMLAALLAMPRPPRLFHASTSEVFGPDAPNPQNESTPAAPANPYAESKDVAHAAVRDARERGLFAAVGILYNHESPLRPDHFVTRKITRAAAEIAAGTRESVTLGNLEVSRDWGAAADYVIAMVAALRHDEPDDFVVATGTLHTLRELVETAFAAAGADDPWSRVVQDPDLLRASDTRGLTGDPTKARDVLGWSPTIGFDALIDDMVRVDLLRVASGVEESVDYLQPRA